MKKKRVLSGIQPTGKLHLGNLVGAVENWARLQETHDCFFFIADLHALTTAYAETQELHEDIRQLSLDLLAAGLDPEKCTLFKQSELPEHSELHLIFSMITPLPWLERVPTYKGKIEELKERDLGTYGFLGYPVLQAADILMYKADLVPVGEDQLPHLELTREIARRFNFLYGNVFPEPQANLTQFPVLPGTDGRKMSKSYQNTIALADPPETIRKKVSLMVTDPERIKRDDPGHPNICPVYAYYKVFSPHRLAQVTEECLAAQRGCVECKKELAQLLIDYLGPIQTRRAKLEKDPQLMAHLLANGAAKAKKVASQTLQEVKKAVGLE